MVSNPAQETQAQSGNSPASVDKSTGEIVESKRPFSDAELRNLNSFEGIRSLLGDAIADATEMGNGFAILDSEGKSRLVGVPTVFLHWTFNSGDQGEFVSALCVTTDSSGSITGKYVVNDGSTGIYQQLREYTDDKHVTQGLFAPKGLRRSDYTVEVNGKDIEATTFYVDTSPVA